MTQTTKPRSERGIYWQRAWSIVEGCTHCSPGCANCWSAAATSMRACQSGKVRERYASLTTNGAFNGVVRFQAQELAKPLRTRKPTTWAVWNDLFHEGVTDEQIAKAFGVMAACRQHIFFVLTKRANRLSKWFSETKNGKCGQNETWRVCYAASGVLSEQVCEDAIWRVWPLRNIAVGVTCEDQQRADERIPHLLNTPASVRWVSVEPMLGQVNLDRWLNPTGQELCVNCGADERKYLTAEQVDEIPAEGGDAQCLECGHGASLTGYDPGIDLVVVGPETGPKRRPCDPEWIRSIVEQCKAAGVPVWVKAFPIGKRVSHDMSEWPEWARVREMPEAHK